MQCEQSISERKKVYIKPEVTVVELKPDQVLAAVCKAPCLDEHGANGCS